jgi:hypothetical protein
MMALLQSNLCAKHVIDKVLKMRRKMRRTSSCDYLMIALFCRTDANARVPKNKSTVVGLTLQAAHQSKQATERYLYNN